MKSQSDIQLSDGVLIPVPWYLITYFQTLNCIKCIGVFAKISVVITIPPGLEDYVYLEQKNIMFN